MKRNLRRILYLFLVVLISPLFSLTALAEDNSAELNSLHFDITLLEDGSALITETREIVCSGDNDFTRYGVKNLFTGPRVFSDWQVSIDGMPLTQLDEPDNEYRPENTFAVEDNNEGNTVYIYYRQWESGTRVFRISYCVENAVKLYSDVGEFFWNLTADTGISDIGTLTATLTVPEGIPDEDFNIWAHGPLNGTFEKQSDDSAFLQIDNVPLGTIVDIRVTLPAYCFYGGWEQDGEALPEILAKEKELADSANAKREAEALEKAKRDEWETKHPVLTPIERFCNKICTYIHDNSWNFFGLSLFFLLFGTFFVIGPMLLKIQKVWHRYKLKKYRKIPTLSPQYNRDLPDNWPAPAVDKLVHFYDGNPDVSRQISASLLELNLNKLLRFETTAGDAAILLNDRQGEEQIPGYQKTLWDFLWDASDRSGRISMKDLKKYIKDNKDAALKFRKSFVSEVEKEFSERVKTTDLTKHVTKNFRHWMLISAAAGVFAMLFRILATMYERIRFVAALKAGLIAFVIAMIIQFLIFVIRVALDETCCILDQRGEDDLALWQAFGRFLDDFTTFEDKELPEFSVWREYMVYAVAIGNGQKVAKALALKYPEALAAGTDTYNDDIYPIWQDMNLYDAMDSIGHEVAEVRSPSSSSDGDGGGFSDSGGGSDSGSGGDFID